jgi:hypothetical protein
MTPLDPHHQFPSSGYQEVRYDVSDLDKVWRDFQTAQAHSLDAQARFLSDVFPPLHRALIQARELVLRQAVMIQDYKLTIEGDLLYQECERLRAENERLREQVQNTLHLLRTGIAPGAWGMSEHDWMQHKINKAAGELSRALESQTESA